MFTVVQLRGDHHRMNIGIERYTGIGQQLGKPVTMIGYLYHGTEWQLGEVTESGDRIIENCLRNNTSYQAGQLDIFYRNYHPFTLLGTGESMPGLEFKEDRYGVPLDVLLIIPADSHFVFVKIT